MRRDMKSMKWMLALCLALPSAARGAETSQSSSHRITPAAGAPLTLPPVVASVNGVEIGVNQFWRGLINSAGSNVLTALVDDILIEQEYQKKFGAPKAKKGDKTEQEVDRRFEQLRKQFQDEQTFQKQLANAGISVDDIKRQIRLGLYKEKLLDDAIKVTPAEVKAYFDGNKQQLAVPAQVQLKHILVGSEQEAKDLQLALRVGANFEMLAKEKSLDPNSRERGGDLGSFGPGMLQPEIEQKVFNLQKGEMDVVRTPLGFHLIKVVEKTPAREAVWNADTQKALETAMRQAKFNQEYPRYIQNLRGAAQIQVFLNQ